MPKDYYEILGVERSASSDDIKKAFRQLGKKYHPDVSTENDAHARFQEVNEAYQILSDPDKRRAYDRYGHAGVNFDGAGFSGGFPDIEDIFGDIFGAFSGRSGTNNRRRARQGRDLRHDLHLTFEQAVFGDEIEIEINRYESCSDCQGTGAAAGTSPTTCPDCSGTGQVRTPRATFLGTMITITDCQRCVGTGKVIDSPCRTCTGKGKIRRPRRLTVTIPGGVDDGTQIRLANEGEPGELGGPNGNLYVVLSVGEHPYFKRRNSDILLEININMAQATLGDRIMVPTVDGEHELKIDAGTQPGTILRIKDKGFPKLRPDSLTRRNQYVDRGDQLCVVNVVVPTKVTPEQRELLEKLAQTLGTDIISKTSGKGIFDRVVNFFSGS